MRKKISTISIIHPSRGRAEQSIQTAENWLSKSSKSINIEYILSIDTTDTQKNDYTRLFCNNYYNIIIYNNTNVVEASNVGGRLATGDIIVLVSDDFDCPEFWDISLVDVFSKNSCCILKTFDGQQKWIVTLPIMDKAYYQMQGYIYHPVYKHMFADTDQTHKADLEGKLLFRNDLLFKHNHYTTGAVKKDGINDFANSTWIYGEATYLQRVKECFGYKGLDPFDVCDLGSEHMDWLRKKIRK